MKRSHRILIGVGAAVLSLCIIFLLSKEKKLPTAGLFNRVTVNEINEHIETGEIILGTSEEELIRLWGQGEFIEGFGGHFRRYPEKLIGFGIAGDPDNDLYLKVSSIDMKNPEYRLFDIRIGDSVSEASVKLQNHGFSYKEEELYTKDEFTVAIRGKEKVDQLQIWFNDKDLRDRVY